MKYTKLVQLNESRKINNKKRIKSIRAVRLKTIELRELRSSGFLLSV